MEEAARPESAHFLPGTQESFGWLLRRYRHAAGLTQEELAERAHLSARTVSDLERELNLRPRKDSIALLVQALGLAETERIQFEDAARQEALLRTDTAAKEQALGTGPVHARAGIQPGPRESTNLPRALTSFIGRTHEQVTIARLLQEVPLVTLTGVGGCGKTRLALQVAGALLASYPHGVWLVELAPLTSPALVPGAVAGVLGVREEPGRPLPAILAGVLQFKRLLLVLDNCEHLVVACAELATRLLQTCAGLQILATSREPLGIAGERVWRVPSLALPDPQQPVSIDRLRDSEAVQLFVARAQAARPAFALTAQNAGLVVQVCRRLDAMPLALELAAARISAISLEALAARLDARFRLLTGGSRTALPRQQTLRATLDWSYALLSEAERALLRRHAVFAGGWTLAAAEAVGAADGIEPWRVLDLLAGLVNKSLASLEEAEDQAGCEGRYGLIETVRQYALEQLVASGEAARAREQHLDYYLSLAEQAEPALEGREQGAWLDRLANELDNLRAALRWAQETGQVARGLRLAGAVRQFWDKHGHWSEGRRWLEEFLALTRRDGVVEPTARARALSWVSRLAFLQHDIGGATEAAEQSIALFRQIGDPLGLAEALCVGGMAPRDFGRAAALLEESVALRRGLGDRRGLADSLFAVADLAIKLGNLERAVTTAQESLTLYRELDHRWDIAGSSWLLGELAREQGDLDRALVLGKQALALFRDLGERRGVAMTLWQLAAVVGEQGDVEQAIALCEESVAVARNLGSDGTIAQALLALGQAAHARGDAQRAGAVLAESLTLMQATGASRAMARCLAALAAVACGHGEMQRTVRVAGASMALFTHYGAALQRRERALFERTVAAARTALQEDAFAAAWVAGQTLPLDAAIADALPVE
jgi:non-specific serine/threonine protein kinase